VWAGACAGELLGLRGGLECSDLDYLTSALDGKRGALERQPTKHVRTHTHKLKPLNHFTVVPHPLSPLRFIRDGGVGVSGDGDVGAEVGWDVAAAVDQKDGCDMPRVDSDTELSDGQASDAEGSGRSSCSDGE